MNGKSHGHGVMIYPDGGRYEGEFKHNKRSGYGKMVYADGTVFEGIFEEDEPVKGEKP